MLLVTLAGCDKSPEVSSSSTGQMPQRTHNKAQLAVGENIFKKHCAVCHGANGEGHHDWRRRNPDGSFPPPPLNGTGHAWHHSTEVLFDVIYNGSQGGEGKMPAWNHTLSRDEVMATIAWFQSLWSDEVYAAWYEMQQRK